MSDVVFQLLAEDGFTAINSIGRDVLHLELPIVGECVQATASPHPGRYLQENFQDQDRYLLPQVTPDPPSKGSPLFGATRPITSTRDFSEFWLEQIPSSAA